MRRLFERGMIDSSLAARVEAMAMALHRELPADTASEGHVLRSIRVAQDQVHAEVVRVGSDAAPMQRAS